MFSYTIEKGTRAVIARRRDGQRIISQTQPIDRNNPEAGYNSPHCMSDLEILDTFVLSKNAYHFIWKINQRIML
jgi:hypothetical protein